MKQLDIRNILLPLLIVVIIFLLMQQCRSYREVRQQEDLVEALADSVFTYINKDNRQVAKIQVIETDNAKLFSKLPTKDKEIQKLQNVVKKYKKQLKKEGSATVLQTETKFDTIYQVLNSDTGIIRDTNQISNSITSDWIVTKYGFLLKDNGDVDSTFFNLQIQNKYSIVIGRERTGFLGLGRGKPFAEVTNYNPYTTNKSLRTYQVSAPKPKRMGIGINVGYGIHASTKGGISHGVNLSIGFNYNFIEF